MHDKERNDTPTTNRTRNEGKKPIPPDGYSETKLDALSKILRVILQETNTQLERLAPSIGFL